MARVYFMVVVVVLSALIGMVLLVALAIIHVLRRKEVLPGSIECSWTWERMRVQCKMLRMGWAICIGLLFDILLSVPILLVLALAMGPESAVAFGLLAVILIGSVFSLLSQMVWEDPTFARSRSFFIARARQKGVPSAALDVGWFVGAAQNPAAKPEGDWSDDIGLLVIGRDELHFYGDAGEAVIPRPAVKRLLSEPPKGDSLSLFGVRVVGVVWSDAAAVERVLYFLVRGGATTFSYKKCTDRLREELAAWVSPGAVVSPSG